jgi:mRNA interferase MazF
LVARDEVVWLELEQEGRRPVVVLTRDDALPRLRNVVVALVTRTIRGIDTEAELGPADGLPVECVVSLDNLRTVPQALLTESITRLDPDRINDPAVPLDRKLTDMTEHEFMLALPYRSRGRARHGLMQLLELEVQQPDGELKPVETAAR